ncbi:hypothetical protein [Marilutibacter alkalisoli]|uniref:Uncharacterized protein n=1 Tax=Marilutibacter alkalisoli TaxID=2591633 RepID=A0A514BTZ9_9GAMM|nr:hypothetical protein [Lysobacter alkalisoli]QDH70884.1 hypothetical protein FKV23_12905 [Lysobacter alkalisoli]
MSRSGYSDDCDDNLDFGRWRGRVAQATRGKRGQQLLRDLAAAMDAMPEKKLIAHNLTDANGCHCALGAVAARRGIDTAAIEFPVDPWDVEIEDTERVAEALDIAYPLACEVMFINDESYAKSDEERWQFVRKWVASQIIEPTPGEDPSDA